MDIHKAYEEIRKEFPKLQTLQGALETDDLYGFRFDKEEAYHTINKDTGALGHVWIWEAFDLPGVKEIDREEVERAA